jgi:hypothetical protein
MVSKNELIQQFLKKEADWVKYQSGMLPRKYVVDRDTEVKNNLEAENFIMYKKEKIKIYYDSGQDYSYSLHFGLKIIWKDSNYDLRLIKCANILRNKSDRFCVHSIYQYEDSLELVFKDDIPSLYDEGETFKIENTYWKITKVSSLINGVKFLYPNYGSWQERIDAGIKYIEKVYS